MGKRWSFLIVNYPVVFQMFRKVITGLDLTDSFINDGYSITRAEMSQEENERTYAEHMKPFGKVREFVKNLQ
jgi:hypothetical protein